MLDLSSLPQSAFASGLEYNLEQLGSLAKVYDHFLNVVREHLAADACWLRRSNRENRVVREDYASGKPRRRDEGLISAFIKNERPQIPKDLLLSPLRVHGRMVGLVAAERHRAPFERGRGWTLNRLASVMAQDLSRREEERSVRVLDDIREKVVAELRPRDLAYQILDGLFQLVHYDHSAALLIHEPARRVLRVEADKIAWTKSKSAFIGHEVALTDEAARVLASPAPIFAFPGRDEHERKVEGVLFDLLYFHRGTGIPEPRTILCAPLFFDGELLGLLKIAARERLPFDDRDKAVAKRFLPAASVALRNARERLSLENQAIQAEIRAGLVTMASAIAHDVNNALGSLLPLAEQVRDDLRTGDADAPTLVEDMDVVVDKARLCKRIFTNMLKLGTTRAGRGPLDVHAVVNEMMPMLTSYVQPRNVSVHLAFAESFPPVRFSRAHLERVVWNLVTNAVEALSGREGNVAIETRVDDDGRPTLTVSDDGPGIPEEELALVMEPFHTTKSAGTGLGLTLCRSLAWQSGGRLRLDSVVDEGTRATLSFPGGEDG